MTAPNILLVVTDEQRPDLVGAFGQVPVQTPALDRVCAEGIALRRAYAACPLCTPSRASIISGQYPSRHQTWTNGVRAPDDMLSLPRLLAERAGYRTAMIGKSHLRPGTTVDPVEPGRRPANGDDVNVEGLVYDWDFFRTWSGPWYGFEHARISIGHVYSPVAYSMHYGAWLDAHGIRREPPYFMTYDDAKSLLGDPGLPGHDGLGDGSPAPPSTWALPERYHSSTWVADETIAYLRDHARDSGGRPFFVYANFPDPHPPFAVPEPWDTMYEDVELPPPVRRLGEWNEPGKPEIYRAVIENRLAEAGWHKRFESISPVGVPGTTVERTPREERWWRTYLGMQSLVDKHFGRILDELGALGLADETLVVFTSDHGEHMGDHFLWGKSELHYDAGARVPLLVRWPGRIPAGTQSSSLQSLVDLAPTFMAAAGLEPHPDMQGVDQLAAWEDPATGGRDALLIESPAEAGLEVDSYVTDRYRLSVHSDLAHGRTELELYDLAEDPGELDSLAQDPGHAALLAELLERAALHALEVDSVRAAEGAFED